MTKLIDGKLHTKESIVKAYWRMVYYYAGKLAGAYELEDLASEGFIGLLHAFEKYDAQHGIPFSTFAHHRIYQHLLRVVRKPPTGPHYPHSIVLIAWQIRREDIAGLPAEQIAQKLDEPVIHVERALMYLYTRYPVKLDSLVPGHETETTLHEVIGQWDDTSDIYFRDFIDSLSDMEKEIIRCLERKMSQVQIGEVIGYSQMQVSRFVRAIREKYNRYEMKGAM